ncbi:MAG: hypothetical protein PHV34_13170 [Verrucomicrobiae bacterium]|nr:hypothetical protein [Verrucomicrobiae bacterium]
MFLDQQAAGKDIPAIQPLPMDQIRTLYENKNLSDASVVNALVDYLNERILQSKQPTAAGAMKGVNPARDIAILIRLIAKNPHSSKSDERMKAIRQAMEAFKDSENAKDLISYLNLAIGLNGEKIPENQVLGILTQERVPPEIIIVLMDAMSKSDVPIRALPELVRRSKDPFYYDQEEGVGLQSLQRIYPVREAAYSCLLRLGVRCDKERRNAVEDDKEGGVKRGELIVNIDRTSLLMALQKWLAAKDADVWQAALDVVADLSEKDILKTYEELKKSGVLSKEKVAYFENKPKQKRQSQ